MTVQEFAVHILLARANRIEQFSWVLETQAQPLYQARIMGRDIRFERMTAAPGLSYFKLLYAFYQNALINAAVFPLN